MKKKPVVLITGEQTYMAPIKASAYTLEKAYTRKISQAGGIPVCALSFRFAEEYSELADALVLTGGSHIHPGHYKEPFYGKMYASNYMRDEMELHIFQQFFQKGKPILGIGRGMQLINVALGGSLIQNLVEQNGVMHNVNALHLIQSESNSLIHSVFGNSCAVNSFHDQAINKLGEGLIVTARASDAVIEAVEHREKPVFGVQFHPERFLSDGAEDASVALFRSFLARCQ